MTAIRAHSSAFETATNRPATTTPATACAPPGPAQPAREIRLPGSSRTYELRDVLRGMGLRWDPCSHAWHGTLPPEKRALLERDLRLPVQAVVPIEAFPAGQEATATSRPEPPRGPSGPSPRPGGLGARPALRNGYPTHPSGASYPRSTGPGTRTRAEALVAFPDMPTSVRGRFTLLDITSGLADDSREADERAAARRLADLRGRVKAARRAVATVPGAVEVIWRDWRKEAAFLARFGVTQAQFRQGVPAGGGEIPDEGDAIEGPGSPWDSRDEVAARALATLPNADSGPLARSGGPLSGTTAGKTRGIRCDECLVPDSRARASRSQ